MELNSLQRKKPNTMAIYYWPDGRVTCSFFCGRCRSTYRAMFVMCVTSQNFGEVAKFASSTLKAFEHQCIKPS